MTWGPVVSERWRRFSAHQQGEPSTWERKRPDSSLASNKKKKNKKK